MEKYTVDLDKVLNDFEYSELTDHHQQQQQQQQQVRTQPNHTYNNNNNNNRVKDSVSKHSINNVFHSLNEYLNTDVDDGSDVIVTDNKNVVAAVEDEKAALDELINNCASVPLLDLLSGDEVINDTTEPQIAVNVGVLLLEPADKVEEVVEERVEEIVETENAIESSEEENNAVIVNESVNEIEVQVVESKGQVTEEVGVLKGEECNKNDDDNQVVGFDQPVELEEAELDKYLEELEDEHSEKNVEIENSVEEEKVPEEKSCVTRPDSLQLPVVDSNEPKKDINLVGEPGSTPYNNMYVTKELQPTSTSENHAKTNDEIIIEESSSPSPTFSDESTGSTTPSTETLNDDENENQSTNNETQAVESVDVPETQSNVAETISSCSSSSSTPEEEIRQPQAAEATATGSAMDNWLGKQAPLWIPDSEAVNCMHCDMKFTVIKRRHHCRACGLVLCSKCCYLKLKLQYLDAEARVCNKCYEILSKNDSTAENENQSNNRQQPNPNNPMEYCSMVPPLQQMSGTSGQNTPPTVMVPVVGVLKRTGSNKKSNKSVMFCDGIRPGSDLTSLDNDLNYESKMKKLSGGGAVIAFRQILPTIDPETKSFIPNAADSLPPTATVYKSDVTYSECGNNLNVVEMLKNEILTFAIQRNFFVLVKIINMDCCINKLAWCFSTNGLINVGQDEIVILLEFIDGEKTVPKDIFYHINNIYNDAVKGITVKELGLSLHNHSNFLDSKNHSGFLYIRPTFQCLSKIIIPKEQYLIGILIHRWETPWAKIFPLRLILRLGAEYRYYPSPIISTRHRESVYFEIGHTIIKLLADFRNYSYTLQQIRGLTIHMEDKNTTVNIPINRYDQVMKAINNSSDHILAFGACFSPKADSHLVCIQDANGSGENSSYNTHAINIQNKPRKVTGASFIVFNGALKTSSGLTAKSSIIEDGLMIQIPPENMEKVRNHLKNMKNYTIQCGCMNAESDETVSIVWGEPDTSFNVGVESGIDKLSLNSIPSIRVHNGKDFVSNTGNRFIRWTEVFIIQNCEENSKNQDAINVSKISESIAKAVCQALVKYLDLLATNNFQKIGVRVTLNVDNVSYCAGGNNMVLPPIYMKSLDNELVPVLHRITANNLGESTVILELIFRILNV